MPLPKPSHLNHLTHKNKLLLYKLQKIVKFTKKIKSLTTRYGLDEKGVNTKIWKAFDFQTTIIDQHDILK